MKYSFTCPAPCNYTISVDARDDDEGLKKIVERGKAHVKDAHPDMPAMTEEQMRAVVRTGMRKTA